ncbi:MAG TPA: GAF domain-containing SpoIIE family protein phosphatase [Mycobacteriales bacterium]|nr:GAF domain-containing SpoIIE family protein phosphatase [Mycobacteriales bacterium]
MGARVGGAAPAGELLAAVLRSTAGAADADEVMTDAAQLLAGGLADWVIADRLTDPDLIIRVAALGLAGPLQLPGLAGSARARRSSARAGGLLATLLESPVPGLRLSPDDITAMAGSADPRLSGQAELAASLGTVDALVLGTASRGRLHGVLTVGRTRTPFSAADRELLALVAGQVGLALATAGLLEAQRSVSAAMQRSLLPPLPQVPGLDLAARYQTATEGLDVGGDWYDAFHLADGALAVVIGDATAHDTAAAATMAGLRNQLRALALDRGEQPAATLTRLDRTGSALGEHASATCLYARLERLAEGWAVRWSSAGHLPPVLVRGGAAVVASTPPELMLGVDPESRRTDHDAHLASGDLLLLCTDGLVEQRRRPIDERLEVLRGLVADRAGDHPEQLADALLAALAQHSDDDVALLVVRVI